MPWCVTIMESERGWGQRVDSREYFVERTDADEFVQRFNKDNNQSTVPEWYMYACKPRYVSDFEMLKEVK